MRSLHVERTLSLPHASKAAAHGGGTWCLTVEPREGLEGFVWHVAQSGSGRGSRAGTTSSVSTAKAQAELAGAELEGAAPPVSGSARVEGSITQTAYEVLGILLGARTCSGARLKVTADKALRRPAWASAYARSWSAVIDRALKC